MLRSIKILTPMFAFMLLFMAACDDIFEKNIEDKVVQVNAPPDSLRTILVTHTFWWNFIEGADYYNLQIVSPRFGYIERFILDTTVSEDRFQFSLTPGIYEWRIKAFNSGYSTDYTVSTLFIDSTLDLSLQQIVLKNPAPNSASNKTRLFLKWYKIYSANQYQIEVHQDSWIGNISVGPITTNYDTISFPLHEGNYVWGVKALNNNSESPFTVRNVVIDKTQPEKPVLNSPESGEIFEAPPVVLTWTRPVISGSTITDSIFIASDSINFNNNIIGSYKTVNTKFNFTFSEDGDYFWRVRSYDAAGNKSLLSNIRKIIIGTP